MGTATLVGDHGGDGDDGSAAGRHLGPSPRANSPAPRRPSSSASPPSARRGHSTTCATGSPPVSWSGSTNDARLAHILTADEAERLLGHRRNPTRSGLEDAFQRWLEQHDLPQPIVNAAVHGREVDALFAVERVIVELDGYGTHGDAATFQSDRERDFDHVEEGYLTVRLTRERLTDATAERLRRLLTRRRAAAWAAASSPPAPGPPPCSR